MAEPEKHKPYDRVGELLKDTRQVAIAMNLAAIDALEECVRRKQTTPLWRDGKVVWVAAGPLLRQRRRELARLRAGGTVYDGTPESLLRAPRSVVRRVKAEQAAAAAQASAPKPARQAVEGGSRKSRRSSTRKQRAGSASGARRQSPRGRRRSSAGKR